FLKILFFASLAGIIHSYLLYPALMLILARRKKKDRKTLPSSVLPDVEILYAAYNEESVIEEKIRTALTSNYPASRLKVRVGSDNSTDGTNDIVRKLQ